MDVRGRKWRVAVFLAAVVSFCGCAKPQNNIQKDAGGTKTAEETQGTSADREAGGADTEAEEGGRITIWLDAENEYQVRKKVASYRSHFGGDVKWELVDKSHLTAEQYRREFAEAQEAGTAPDLIYMDTRNGLDPEGLMESGALYGLSEEEFLTQGNGEKCAFVEGAQEIGLRDGKYYVLPLYMECPVVFGLEEDLKAAGIRTEGMYGSLEGFLEAVLAAQEKTGKLIFENTEAVDWLEAYYLPEDAAQADVVMALLEEARLHCGNDTSTYGACRMLEDGECLLGGCGIADYKRMCADLPLFGEGAKPTALAIPDGDGRFRGIVTHAAAINAKTAHPELAAEALKALKGWDSWCPDIHVVLSDGTLFGAAAIGTGDSSQKAVAERAGRLPDGMEETLVDICFGRVSAVSYAQECDDGAEGHGHGEDAQTLSVFYPGCGDGAEYPYTPWLEQAAEAYEAAHEGTHVQLTPVSLDPVTFEIYGQIMNGYGTAPDMMVFEMSRIQISNSADFSALFGRRREETAFLPESLADGVQYENGVTGLPIAAETFGLWYSRSALKKAGLPEGWEPADMEELTEGLEKLNGLSRDGSPYTAMSGQANFIKALSVFAAAPKELLKPMEDGGWRLSKDAWVTYLSSLTGWREKGLVTPEGEDVGVGISKTETLKRLADGSLGAYLGGSAFGAWISGDAVPLTAEQKEDLAFVRLSPMADIKIFFVPAGSGKAEEAFAFWEEAVRQPGYGAAVKGTGCVPVAELPDDILSLPSREGDRSLAYLPQGLWETEMTAEELAEEYKWFRFAEE